MDETKVKVQGRWVYVWAAIDIDSWEILLTWATEQRSCFEALQFLRRVMDYCDGLPMVYVGVEPPRNTMGAQDLRASQPD